MEFNVFQRNLAGAFAVTFELANQPFIKVQNAQLILQIKKLTPKVSHALLVFMSFSTLIPNRGTSQDHMNNNCHHKKRIKQVLLYGVENSSDPGISARNLLVSVLTNPTHWFAIMAVNIETIRRQNEMSK